MRALLFSVGNEQFASPLAALDESVDCPVVIPMPGADGHAVGVIDVRGRRIAAYSPAAALNVAVEGAAGAALVLGSEPSPLALLISDVDDVIEIDPVEIKPAPAADADGVLLGIFQHHGRLVSIVDPYAIRDVCLAAGSRR